MTAASYVLKYYFIHHVFILLFDRKPVAASSCPLWSKVVAGAVGLGLLVAVGVVLGVLLGAAQTTTTTTTSTTSTTGKAIHQHI